MSILSILSDFDVVVVDFYRTAGNGRNLSHTISGSRLDSHR